MDPEHVLYEVYVNGVPLDVCDSLDAGLPDVPLHLLQQNLSKRKKNTIIFLTKLSIIIIAII